MKMHHSIFLFLCTASYICLSAQTNDKYKSISYDCLFNIKFDRGKEYKRFNASLYSSDEMSGFFMEPNKMENKQPENAMDQLLEVDTIFRVVKNFKREGLVFGDIQFNGKEKFYSDTLHVMKWVLENEKKLIDSLLCHKATTQFKGRSYTAWYCPAIPIPNGPWKLGGLPGLIVEAYEDQKDLYFLLSGIRPSQQLTVPKIQQQQEYPDYNSFIKYWKNFFEMINGSMAAQENPGCVSCLSQSKTIIYTWEKISF
jgi:GLPGLI family protein